MQSLNLSNCDISRLPSVCRPDITTVLRSYLTTFLVQRTSVAHNAAEAMGSVEEGARELLISTDQDQASALVVVRDSGPGIDPIYLDRIFDAFYTTKSSGTGMGLSICRSIIHAHGGKLWAEANEPHGAVFQFTLPAVQEDS